MKILVTGSSGLIGMPVCSMLEDVGHFVVGLDKNEPPVKTNFSFFKGDLLDSEARKKALEGIEGVIHFAAVSRVIDAEIDPSACIDINIKGTKALLDNLSQMENPPWIIYGSSREVYGNPSSLPVSETSPIEPVNVYGVSKAAAEALVQIYSRTTGKTAVIFRFSNVYGSLNDHETRVIPAFIRAALTGNTIHLEGAENTFDFNHVDYTANAVRMAVENILDGRLSGTQAFNVVSGRGTTLSELADLIRSISGEQVPVVEDDPRGFDVPRFIGNPKKLEKILGLRSEIPLEEGLGNLIDDFKRQLSNIQNFTGRNTIDHNAADKDVASPLDPKNGIHGEADTSIQEGSL